MLGVKVTTSETKEARNTFFADLVARGLSGVLLVTSDAHAGPVEAIAANLPGAAWQRCRTHYAANLTAVCPKSSWGWVKAGRQPPTPPVELLKATALLNRVVAYVDGTI